MVHGTRASAAQWSAYPPLLPDVDVVAVDLPGHGNRAAETFTWQGALDAVRAEVERDVDRPVVLVGHSLGGFIAAACAAGHPRRLDGLALIGASADPSHPGAALYRVTASAFERIGPRRVAVGVDRLIRLTRNETLRLALGEEPEGYEAITPAWQAVMEHCGPDLLREVECPVLLLNGGLDQLGVHARRYAAAARDAYVVRVPRASHLFPITRPQVTAEVLAEFTEHCRGVSTSAR